MVGARHPDLIAPSPEYCLLGPWLPGHGDDHSQMNHRKIYLFFTDKSSFSGFGVFTWWHQARGANA